MTVLLIEGKINGPLLKEMLLGAAASLESNKNILNDMNVFPVPDGDTGTNMSLTFKSVVKDLAALKDNQVQAVSTAMARGALKGARGNSGVILSQILRGLSVGFDGVEGIDVPRFAQAMRNGAEIAYKSVMKPKEGTILTVVKAMADEALRASRSEEDFYGFFDRVIQAGQIALDKTPEQNPTLKKAGVVDAGGQGLLFIFMAFRSVLNGEEISDEAIIVEAQPVQPAGGLAAAAYEEVDENFPYCTEFFIIELKSHVDEKAVDELRNKLAIIGDSLVVVADTDLVKVHVHTASPGKALQYALKLGELDRIKIENMMQQNRELKATVAAQEEEKEPEKEYGMVSVVAGEGIAAIMQDLGVDYIIEGGQTMNPSTEDILNAVEKVNAKTVFILPNNSNIILAAQQVPALTEKNVQVIPSKSVPQGIAAALAFNPDESVGVNAENMQEALKTVATGQVTYAVRDTNYDNREIHQGDIMGLKENAITIVGEDYNTVAAQLADQLLEGKDMLTILYGQDVTEEQAEQLSAAVAEKHGDCEISVFSGGQPLYYYIIFAE